MAAVTSDWSGGASTPLKDSPALSRELTTLWRWNLACGVLHLVQGIIVVSLSQTVGNIKAFRLPITSEFLVWDANGPRQNPTTLGLLPFAATASAFAFLSAAAHFLVLACWPRYVADLARGLNRFRWFEYAASSSLMIVLIAMLFGVYDVVREGGREARDDEAEWRAGAAALTPLSRRRCSPRARPADFPRRRRRHQRRHVPLW